MKSCHKINVSLDEDKLYTGIKDKILKLVNTSTKDSINIAISGGNSPLKLFKLLASEFYTKDWQKLNIYWVDERLVPFYSDESNAGVFYRLLKEFVKRENLFIIDYKGDEEQALNDYLNKLKKISKKLPIFDLIILGVGSDGHTASIFSKNELNNDAWAFINTHPKTKQKRITLSMKLINNAKEIIVLAKGKEKREILKEILIDNSSSYPASFIDKDKSIWFLDEEAKSW